MNKKSIFKKNSHEIFKDVTRETHFNGRMAYDINSPQTINVTLLPNNQMAPALFKPIDRDNNVYEAHPLTIRAVKPEIFATDNDLTDFSEEYYCFGCKQKIDLQFWKFCPYCEHKIIID